MFEIFANSKIVIIIVSFIFISVLFFWISIVIKYSIKKKLSNEDKKEFLKLFRGIKKQESNKEKIIDYDKLYHKILIKLWYDWTFWEILKREPNEIWNINKVWELHKLRNKLVHEFDKDFDFSLEKKVKEYEKQIEFILE